MTEEVRSVSFDPARSPAGVGPPFVLSNAIPPVSLYFAAAARGRRRWYVPFDTYCASADRLPRRATAAHTLATSSGFAFAFITARSHTAVCLNDERTK